MRERSTESSPVSAQPNSGKSISEDSTLGYLFVKPREKKNEKESSISKFLSGEGVFQINLGVALSDYQFKSE
eukprot:CAMPEP_0205811284 /NCGR_PEP_ID=MMETSP0205-20121125/15459_1 /ASSEMBLY_ACC=CAM_ASM_000278 /TAXON_ID=36767 /ORGANISM="Euplotes focardii, Strain TN1" /LENGTH=71 /DNA_ID=CAMNT_0053090251 /DNA_START=197 /DNA_END=409 /DNA_ORIENTATION=+